MRNFSIKEKIVGGAVGVLFVSSIVWPLGVAVGGWIAYLYKDQIKTAFRKALIKEKANSFLSFFK